MPELQEAFTALTSTVEEWIKNDPDPQTRAEAATLLTNARAGNQEAVGSLADAFSGRLSFGTAGLRAEIGAGPARMNRVVVSQTTAGFASFLLQRAAAGLCSTPPHVIVGYDGRINSDVFARDTAEILAGAGIDVTLLPEPLPTPVVAFGVRHLQASAGIVVTASHNPPRDNGYKVYLGDADGGAQIVSPTDSQIAALIDEVATHPLSSLPRSTSYTVAGPELQDAYISRTAAAARAAAHPDAFAPLTDTHAPFNVVYTAMHGVGSRTAQRVFAEAGLPSVIPVPEQDEPNGLFPTVAFPNPEEPGALDLAYRTGREHQAQLILANDPDADRLAIAAPDPLTAEGYRRLTGNELGLLLGWRAAQRAKKLATANGVAVSGALANTIVSSPALGAVAKHYGLTHAETLSGFKWVSRVPELIFGFEEAIGYLSFPEVVHDKDGISAAAEVLALARELHAAGSTIWDLLEEASATFGHFASSQVTVRLASTSDVAVLAEAARNSPPSDFGGVPVARIRDFRTPGLAAEPANVLAYDLVDGSRVMIRPSGTEPKLKVYLDTFSDQGSGSARKTHAEAALSTIEAAVQSYLDAVGSAQD